LLEHWTTAKLTLLVDDFICSEAYSRMSRGREASLDGDGLEGALQQNNRYIKQTLIDVHAVCFV